MAEKKNHSNNPDDLQPYDENTGKYSGDGGSSAKDPLSAVPSDAAKPSGSSDQGQGSLVESLVSNVASDDSGDGFDIDEDSLDQFDIQVDESTLDDFDDGPDLSGAKADIFNASGVEYGLSKDKLNEASDAEIDELQKAIQGNADLQSKQSEIMDMRSELDKYDLESALSGVWHLVTVKPSDLLDDNKPYKSTIDFKYEFFKSDTKNPEDSAAKIKKLDELVKDSEAYGNALAKLEGKKSEIDGLEKANDAVIAKFLDQNSAYSKNRKDNAVSVGFKNSKFASSEQAFGSIAKKQWLSMSNAERQRLVDFTGSYSSIQEPLYGSHYVGSNTPSEGWKKAIMTMDSALDKCKYDFDCWVQRGMNGLDVNGQDLIGMIAKAKGNYGKLIGRTFRNKAFMSCGSAMKTGFIGKVLTLNIYCPKGTHMHFIKEHSNYTGENETIIARGYELKIRKITEYGGSYFVDVDIMLNSDNNMPKAQDLEEGAKYAG